MAFLYLFLAKIVTKNGCHNARANDQLDKRRTKKAFFVGFKKHLECIFDNLKERLDAKTWPGFIFCFVFFCETFSVPMKVAGYDKRFRIEDNV